MSYYKFTYTCHTQFPLPEQVRQNLPRFTDPRGVNCAAVCALRKLL